MYREPRSSGAPGAAMSVTTGGYSGSRDVASEAGPTQDSHVVAQQVAIQEAETLRQKQDLPRTSRWLLRPHQGRQFLAEEMARLRYTARKRRLLQAIAGSFPTQAVLYG
jgi:hypothetical protein